jgi:hypothetical protein
VIIVSPNGRRQKRLMTGGVTFPVAWAPDSKAVLVLHATKPALPFQLFIVPLPAGRPIPVRGTDAAVGSASWHR